ncbi:hypothetical protein F2Q70_00009999 [Brassica cretica]|uniref:Uncharacterized protein n=1 Tax=Brassica cretica TaxID=69181 RepID=A0A8S9LXY5_BRACR|nr:hypothetical protein F2Q70_00009999 [Brassica cretica]
MCFLTSNPVRNVLNEIPVSFSGIFIIDRSLVLSYKASATSGGIRAGKIQDEGNEFEVKGIDNWRGDLLLQKILVKGNYTTHVLNYGTNWASTKGGPTCAFTHHRDKEDRMDISFMMIMLFTAQVDVDRNMSEHHYPTRVS